MEANAAVAGDILKSEDLQSSIDQLLSMAEQLDRFLETAKDTEAAQQIGRKQADLRALAGKLVVQQIDLLAGEAKVTADQINAATKHANDVISKIATWKERLTKIAAVLGFFTVVLTGNGTAIFKAAGTLKTALDAA
jgi:chromosome segregation ATPase